MPALLKNLMSVTSNFQVTLGEIRKTKFAESFEKDFTEVLEVLKKATEARRLLLNRCKELCVQVSIHQQKQQEAQERLLDAEETCNNLRKDLTKAGKCIENLGDLEIKYKETIRELSQRVFSLENETDDSIQEKEKKFELEAERERKLLNSRISQLESELKARDAIEKEINSKLLETMKAMEKIEVDTEKLRVRLKQELERGQIIVRDRHCTEKEMRDKEANIRELEETVTLLKRRLERTSKKVDSYESRVVAHQQRIDSLQELYKKTQEQARVQLDELNEMSAEKEKLVLLVEKKEEALKALNGKLIDIANEKESTLQRCLIVKNQKQSSDSKCESLEKILLNTERDTFKMKKQIAHHDSEVSTLTRDKELLAKNIIKMETIIEKYSKESKSREREKIKLRQELKNAEKQIEKQNKIISSLEEIKSQLLKDIKSLSKKIENMNENITSHEDMEASLEAKVIQLSSELSQQKDILTGALLDRKIFCQKYKEMKENREQLKQKVELLDNYVNELNEIQRSQIEEISTWKKKYETLDVQLKTLNGKLSLEEKEHSILKVEWKHLNEQMSSHLQVIASKEKEIKTLNSKIANITEENTTLRAQMQQQKKDLLSLEEKVKQSEFSVSKEEEKYATLKHGTKLLHMEILRLTGEKNSLTCKVNDLQKLKQSFAYAKQELHRERHKNSALETAMQHPLNIHRWRLLKGTDPDKYELIESYQTVHKQLLKKCIEIEEKDKKLSNMEKLVDQLKALTSKGKYFEEMYLKEANQNQVLREKNRKIKTLSFEVNMNETYMSSYQSEINSLKDELRKIKLKQFFRDKRKISPETMVEVK